MNGPLTLVGLCIAAGLAVVVIGETTSRNRLRIGEAIAHLRRREQDLWRPR